VGEIFLWNFECLVHQMGHVVWGFFSFRKISPTFSSKFWHSHFLLALRLSLSFCSQTLSFFSVQSFTGASIETLATYFEVVSSSTKVFIWVVWHTNFRIRASFRLVFPILSLFLLTLKLSLFIQSCPLSVNWDFAALLHDCCQPWPSSGSYLIQISRQEQYISASIIFWRQSKSQSQSNRRKFFGHPQNMRLVTIISLWLVRFDFCFNFLGWVGCNFAQNSVF